jgi:hypothetical protein
LLSIVTNGTRFEKELCAALAATGIDTIDSPVSGRRFGARKVLWRDGPGTPKAVAGVRNLHEVSARYSRGSRPVQRRI